MAVTRGRQDEILRSDVYDDTIAAGVAMETGTTILEDDVNNLRSQLKRYTGAANWYDNLTGRAQDTLDTDLQSLEEQIIVCNASVLTDLTVPGGQNWMLLTVASSEAPTELAAVGATTEGAIVAQSALSGVGFDVHELIEQAGPNAIAPLTLLVLKDTTTQQPPQSSGRDVFGLLQYESTGADGAAFDDVSGGARAKISFVRENAGGNDLEACPVGDIAGLTLNYNYNFNRQFQNLDRNCFISSRGFTDQSATVDVTLDNAIDNQSGPATQVQTIEWRISDTFRLDFQDSAGGVNLLSILPNAAGDELEVNVDDLDFNHTNTADFNNGVKLDSAGTPIDIGVNAGVLETTAADMTLRAALELYIDDGNRSGSTWATAGIKLAEDTAEWSALETAYGGEPSLAAMLVQAMNTSARERREAVLTSNVSADTNVTGAGGGANIDNQLQDYSSLSFVDDVDIFLNGRLQRNGADNLADFDVYPGDTPANGDLKFEKNLKGGGSPDRITMVTHGA